MRKIGNSKITGTVQLGSRTIYLTRDGRLHVSDGSGPTPSEAEVIAAVRAETAARRAITNELRATLVLKRIGKFVN